MSAGVVRRGRAADSRAAVSAAALVVAGLVAAVVCGWIASRAPAALVAGAAVAVPAAVVIVLRPAAGLVLLLAVVTLVPQDTLATHEIPVGGASVRIHDVLLVLVTAGWFARASREEAAMTPRVLLVALVALLAAGLLGVLTARINGTPLNTSLLELRYVVLYLLVLPAASLARDPLARGQALRALATATLVSAGFTLHAYLSGGGSRVVGDIVEGRVLGDAFLLPMLASIFALSWVAAPPAAGVGWKVPALAVVSLGALFFTFQRGAWLGLIAAVVAVLAMAGAAARRRIVAAGVVGLACLLIGVGVVGRSTGSGPGPLAVGYERLVSVGDLQDVSKQHRIAEWRASWRVIEQHPLAGIGLGSSITFWSPAYSETTHRLGGSHTTFYIHSSYVWAWLKLGLFGLCALVALLAWGIIAGWREQRRAGEATRWLLLGATGGLVAMAVLSWSGPHLTLERSTPMVAVMLGLVAGLVTRRGGANEADGATR